MTEHKWKSLKSVKFRGRNAVEIKCACGEASIQAGGISAQKWFKGHVKDQEED